MTESVWTLAITKEQFKEIYNDSIDISLFTSHPTTEEDLIVKYLSSKLWRLNNLYTIIDKDGQRIPFKMNLSQHRVYAASLKHPRLIILKSRQQGISTFWLLSFLDDAIVLPDFQIGLMAQGKSEASTLLKRVNLAWTTFSPELKEFLALKLLRDNTEELSFSNNSTLFIRTSFRSATLQRLHISEFGKIANKYPDRANETKTGTLQAIRPGNTVVIESTAEGENEFKRMWVKAEEAKKRVETMGLPAYAGKDFMPVFLSWLDDPDCVSIHPEEPSLKQLEYFSDLEAKLNRIITTEQRNFWIQQYRELGEAIYQEYPATPEEAFTKIRDGSYYANIFSKAVVQKGHIVDNLYDPALETYVMMDLGVNDMFVLAYFQRWRTEWRIIDEYMNTGEGLEFYVGHMKSTPYDIAKVICPHDIRVTELGTGKSRLARLRELGVSHIEVLPRMPILDGIEKVRATLPNMWFDSKCTYLADCMRNYSKEWDETHGVWKAKPLHDHWSHGADTIRGIVMSNAAHISDRDELIEARESSGVVDGLAI